MHYNKFVLGRVHLALRFCRSKVRFLNKIAVSILFRNAFEKMVISKPKNKNRKNHVFKLQGRDVF
jgi:hypothetical protein